MHAYIHTYKYIYIYIEICGNPHMEPMSTAGHLKADAPADASLERFVKLTEDNRRERQRRIDAGAVTAVVEQWSPSGYAESWGRSIG
jgi:hypothetical protein